ncbi:D-2-hydroxyacid dehydrogenase (plasmid) [Rhodococcus opacus]|uniref:Phosphoglycerate dehydrogenase n=1 Tax=Rhodococcus opacus M213 TaxID=1129896 RepID=K8XJ16_RHOOP|nr:D-2-hydroxyacid dehydrogenase [Rhodococcus opacus]EKT81404.1 phosphoglycerate dehydrogenase [Rhodococcus opacus M213]ELB89148.1 phosphoglycerate dehydrogenase [Rhodococcus wratislaviensis IFP 2016]WKN59964.1 D-2-hydroxyacid dehydrogenase [Rhodococcus opacus]
MSSTIKVAIATPLDPGLRHLLTEVDPSVDLLVDDALLPPQRFPGDHEGDPAFRRTRKQQAVFDSLLSEADIFYGIPDTRPAALAPAVRANPGLRWVQTMAAGGGAQVKAADLTAEELERVLFTTSAGVHGRPLAEFAILGVLAGAKDLPRLQSQQAARHWSDRWAMKQVHEQTVLVVGLGGIGKETARLAKALGATVLGTKRQPGPVDHVDEVHPLSALPELVGRADAIVFTLPGTTATDGLYGAELIAATKPGAVIVNVGRGTVINEPSLIDGLQSGHLASAFLDVVAVEPLPTESPLWAMPQVVIAPHTAALSPHEDRRIAELFATNLRRLIDGKELLNVVDTQHFY